jgi:hypothetical protein
MCLYTGHGMKKGEGTQRAKEEERKKETNSYCLKKSRKK